MKALLLTLLVTLAAQAPTAAAAAEPGPDPAATLAPAASPAEVMALPPALRDALASAVRRQGTVDARLNQLMAFLFDPATGLGMRYDPDATVTVAEAFASRRANCLGFTLLTIALAREVGLEADAHFLGQVLTWEVASGTLVRANHVNTVVRLHGRRFTIDVASDQVLGLTLPRRISDRQLLALYYGNRAMERVVAGDLQAAAPYMALSLELDPESADALNNAGVLAARRGDAEAATRQYLAALDRDAMHWGALSNLSQAHARSGDKVRAREFERRSARARDRDPLYQFAQGDRADADGDPARAIAHYRRAIRLHPAEHRFHFALARSYLRIGDARRALKALAAARALADGAQGNRYQAKIDLIRARGH